MHSERKSQCMHIERPKGGKPMTNPVRVEDAEVTAAAGDALFGGRTERTLELELVDTLVGGLTVRSTFSRPKPRRPTRVSTARGRGNRQKEDQLPHDFLSTAKPLDPLPRTHESAWTTGRKGSDLPLGTGRLRLPRRTRTR